MSPTPTPFEVARFLRSSALLDKKQIGEYLGKKKDFNIQVLQEYVSPSTSRTLTFSARCACSWRVSACPASPSRSIASWR